MYKRNNCLCHNKCKCTADSQFNINLKKESSNFICIPTCNDLFINTFDNKNYEFHLNNKFIRLHFYQKYPFYEYINIKEGTVFFCGKNGCFKKYTTKNGILYHMRQDTPEKEKKSFHKCPIDNCLKNYKTKTGLKYHLEIIHKKK